MTAFSLELLSVASLRARLDAVNGFVPLALCLNQGHVMKSISIVTVLCFVAVVGLCGQVKSVSHSDLPDAPSRSKANTDTTSSGSSLGGRTPATPSTPEGWPREIKSGANTFVIYQPQLESWTDNSLRARSAVAVTPAGASRTYYGVIWMSARTQVDKQNRMVTLTDASVDKVKFPSAPGEESAYLAIIQKSVINKTRLISLDRLEALAEILDAEKNAATVTVNNDPPSILFSPSPTILVYLDGEPVYRPVKGTGLQRVINTRCLVLRDAMGKHYLHLMDGWMESSQISGPWAVAKQVTQDLAKAEKDAVASGQVDMLTGRADPKKPGPSLTKTSPPKIVVATSPTELIVTQGEPKFVDVPGVQVRYVENTTGHIFLHVPDNKLYVLISGRWFAADSMKGPWTYVPGGKLPSDFGSIPDDSPKENVKASIPGTPQALEAVIANSIPQTATVNRKDARMDAPRFDGQPQWKPIEGTSLHYATNTSWPVVRVKEDSYYAVENGIWFKASAVNGPWIAADSVAPEIYSIPPSSPLHNITYVKIYSANPDTISVGYTSGYYGTCVTHGSGPVVVYGTGYRYSPWIGTVWYGAPLTYGYGSALTFTPWTGWTYGFGFGLSVPETEKNSSSNSSQAESEVASQPASNKAEQNVAAQPIATLPASEAAESGSGSTSVSVSFMYGAYPWWGPYPWGYYYPYPYYYPPYYYPAYGAAWGPYGAAAWGPGGWAATTGNVYQRWGNTGAVTRTSGGFNAWTGNAWARQVGASYNSRTGTLAAGQRSYVANAYTGDYGYGRRGAAYNPNTGRAATGGKYTFGNAGSDQSTTAGWLRGEQGGAARVGNDVYAARDGTVYRNKGNGWESNSGNGWQSTGRPTPQQRSGAAQPSLQSSETRQSLDRQYSARQTGQQRTQNFNSGAYRSAGGARRGGFRRR